MILNSWVTWSVLWFRKILVDVENGLEGEKAASYWREAGLEGI